MLPMYLAISRAIHQSRRAGASSSSFSARGRPSEAWMISALKAEPSFAQVDFKYLAEGVLNGLNAVVVVDELVGHEIEMEISLGSKTLPVEVGTAKKEAPAGDADVVGIGLGDLCCGHVPLALKKKAHTNWCGPVVRGEAASPAAFGGAKGLWVQSLDGAMRLWGVL